MAKWVGKIGFAETVETEPGIYDETIVTRQYKGDLLSNYRKLQSSGEVHDDIRLANKVSIVADPYATQHYFNIRYLEFQGVKWKISDVEVLYPRLILTMGGVYNG